MGQTPHSARTDASSFSFDEAEDCLEMKTRPAGNWDQTSQVKVSMFNKAGARETCAAGASSSAKDKSGNRANVASFRGCPTAARG
jgi:hypothetical protein